jgi:hypothetical protein
MTTDFGPEGVGARDDSVPSRPLSSVGELLGDISRDLSTLMHQEVELAKAEVRESARSAGKGAGMLGGAGLAGWFVLLFLSLALWWLLGSTAGLGFGWAALIVAAIWAVIAAVLAAVGRRNMQRVQGVPRTVETTKEIPDALRGRDNA